MIYLFSLWLALAVAIAAMAVYRKFVAREEDDAIHLSPGTEGLIQHQTIVDGRLKAIDRWGKSLTAIEVVLGLALAAAWLYQVWVTSGRME